LILSLLFPRLCDQKTVDRKVEECGEEECQYVYYSGVVNHGSIQALEEDVDMDDAVQQFYNYYPMELITRNIPLKGDEPGVKFALWMGSKGAYTNAHYDQVHNFYVQIYGVKRFLLLPPSASEDIYIFPKLHPNARQSRINFNEPDVKELTDTLTNFIGSSEDGWIQGYTVDLKPGEVLYLPPGWFHAVWAKSTSISVSMWQSSEDAVVARHVLSLYEKISYRKGGIAKFINEFLTLLNVDSEEMNPTKQDRGASRVFSRTPAQNVQALLNTRYVDYKEVNHPDGAPSQLKLLFAEGCRVSGKDHWSDTLKEGVKWYNRLPGPHVDNIVFDAIELMVKGLAGPDLVHPFLLEFIKICGGEAY
jgi:hypothetical protein